MYRQLEFLRLSIVDLPHLVSLTLSFVGQTGTYLSRRHLKRLLAYLPDALRILKISAGGRRDWLDDDVLRGLMEREHSRPFGIRRLDLAFDFYDAADDPNRVLACAILFRMAALEDLRLAVISDKSIIIRREEGSDGPQDG